MTGLDDLSALDVAECLQANAAEWQALADRIPGQAAALAAVTVDRRARDRRSITRPVPTDTRRTMDRRQQ